jgi:RimJ/RimL family protein N-acetyltransferase
MLIRKYGITLKRLKEEDIELLREMRNSTAISTTMVYREHITPEMQKKWFESINNKYNGYFIIIYEGKKIGLINGKNIDFEKRICEGGIFIWDEHYKDTIIPALASIIMNDWTFLIINFNAIYAKVLQENVNALTYDKLMGYEPCAPLTDEKGVQWLILTKEKYLRKVKLLRKSLLQNLGGIETLTLLNVDSSDDLGKEIELFYKDLPSDIQEKADELLERARR